MKSIIIILISQLLHAADWPDMSIYHLNGVWKNHSGKETQITELSGSPAIVAMVYTSCQHTCPLITNKIQHIRNSLPKELQKKAKYALISFDPEGDTPSVLEAFKKKNKLDEHWILLTSNDHEVRKIAGVLGVNYKKTPDGGYSHSNIVALLDKNGVLITKIERLNQDTSDIIEKLKQLIKQTGKN